MRLVALAAVVSMATAGSAPPPVQIFVEAPGPKGPLKGVMLSPAGAPAPVALIIPGSGPTDRDGDNPLGVKAAPYRLLAEALAARGVASVRIDKRGLFASAGAVPDPNAVTIDDYVDDTRSWVAAIRRVTGVRCVWLVGHSEGALVALASARSVKDLCGVVTVAGPGRPLGAVLRDQLRANPANATVLAQAEAAVAKLEKGERVEVASLHPALQRLFAPAVQDFLISELALDPAALASKLGHRLLIVQGAADLQVALEDARRLKAADPAAELVVLPGVNHVLKLAPADDRGANLATYADPSLPLAPSVTGPIAEFILKR